MKLRDVTLLVLPFLVLGVAAKFAHEREQVRQRRLLIHVTALRNEFLSVKPKNGQVVIMSNEYFWAFTPFTPGLTRTLAVGDQFEWDRVTWKAAYTVQAIEPDGVVLAVRRTGEDFEFSGDAKVKWK